MVRNQLFFQYVVCDSALFVNEAQFGLELVQLANDAFKLVVVILYVICRHALWRRGRWRRRRQEFVLLFLFDLVVDWPHFGAEVVQVVRHGGQQAESPGPTRLLGLRLSS